jgi:NAD-dependent DNA ligase
MGKVKDLTTAFDQIQRDLLKHKYLYYVKSAPIISDYEYDMMENESRKLAKQLGFRADQWEGPEENEKDHVHWMVDFDENHELAESVIKEVENG